MADLIISIVAFLPSLASIGVAGWLAKDHNLSWIAFMIIAVLMVPSVKVNHP